MIDESKYFFKVKKQACLSLGYMNSPLMSIQISVEDSLFKKFLALKLDKKLDYMKPMIDSKKQMFENIFDYFTIKYLLVGLQECKIREQPSKGYFFSNSELNMHLFKFYSECYCDNCDINLSLIEAQILKTLAYECANDKSNIFAIITKILKIGINTHLRNNEEVLGSMEAIKILAAKGIEYRYN